MTENFPNLGNETDIKVKEAQDVSKKMNPKGPIPRPIMITVSKVKDKEKS